MGYDLKNVFYLDGSVSTAQADGTVGLAGDSFSGQFDLSSYVDPIGKGRTSGVGLAIYRVQFGLSASSSGSDPIDMTETGVMRAGLVAGAGTGNVSAGTTLAVNSSNAPSAKNDLTVAAFDYYGPKSSIANASTPGGFTYNEFITPSKEVPYVVVRDNVCLIGVLKETTIADIYIQFRMECAMIPLDKSTLNQLLRTQTV
ncbi:MAG: hypothetical protein [Circular genetic element sp.]|nr:MAG: hypothetical protein [Circular genetic element sp.]